MGLKVQYRRPILTLCDGNYNRLGILSNKTQRSCYNVNLTKKINEVAVLSFDIPSDSLIDYNSTELLVKFGLDYYIIKDVTLSSTDRSMYSVSAEHEATELKGILVSMISEDDSDTEIIGETPEGMWSLLVNSCSMPEVIKNKYIFETDIIDTYRSLEVEDEKGLYEHLVNIAKQFEACLVFEHNDEGKILIKLVAGEIDNKRVVKKGKDLRQLNITLDSSAIFTKIIPFGAVDSETGLEINIMGVTQDGKSYITNYDYYLDQGMTLNEIKNTPKCNQECIYRNSDIVDANELLRVAKKELEQISKPVLNGNIDIINLGCMEGYFENIPVLCERIYVADKVGKYNIFSKVVGVSINYDNPLKSKVEISNVVRYSSTFADIVRTSEAVSKVTTKKKGKPVLSAEKVQGIIDAHTTQIKNKLLNGAEHQGDKLAILFEDARIDSDTYGAIALGTSGILISNEKDINEEWLWTTAIDSQGLSTKMVNAITINGVQVNAGIISSFDGNSWWNLDNNEFNFGNKIKFIDGEFSIDLGNNLENLVTKEDLDEVKDLIDEVDGRLDDALDDIDEVFKDGIIGEVEKRVIEKTLKTLLDQYSNVEYLYEIYKASENLTDETKTTLNNRWRLYDSAYTELTNCINEIIVDEKCTETELASYNLKVEEYYARYSELKNLLEDCQIEASNNYTNTKVSISEGKIMTEISSQYVNKDDLNDALDEQNTKITTIEQKYSTLEQDIDGFKTEVGQKYTTIEEFGQLEVGATNLIRNANFDLGLDVYWTPANNSKGKVTLLPPENDKPTSNILSYNFTGNTSPTYVQKWSNPIPIEWDENGVAEFIFRVEIKSEDWSVVDDAGVLCGARTFVDSDKTAYADCVEYFEVKKSNIDTTNNNWQTVVMKIKATNNTAKYIKFDSHCSQNSNCKYREFMAVKGNRIASTFNINPSDTKEYVDGEIESYTETITREYQSAIEQTKDSILLSVSETYTTKTEIEQMVIGGGDNLLRNGNFADGLDHWRTDNYDNAGTSKTITVTNTPSEWIPKNKSVLQICGLNTNERYGIRSDVMELAPYTKYVISGYCAGHRVDKINVTIRDVDNSYAPIANRDISPVSGGNKLNIWYRFAIPFTTTANGNYVLCLYSKKFNTDASTDLGYVWFTDVQVEEGTKATPWKKCIYDVIENIDDVSNSVTNLNNYIDSAFKDGILDETEKRAIRQQLKTLSAEKADIDNEVTTVINNADLTGTPKTNLSSAYNDYLSKYIALTTAINNVLDAVLVTPTLRESYDTAYNTHNRALATLKQRLMEAIDAIAETKKQTSITTSKTYTDAQLSITADAIRGTVSELREDFTNYQGEVSSTYATKGEMELTSEEFRLTFQKSGSGNLLKNSDCQFGLNGQWVNNGGGLDRDMSNAKPFLGSREPFFKTSFPKGFKYSETVYLKPNTDYVYQAYVYVGSSMSGAKLSPVHFWSWVANPDSSPTGGQAGLTILDYKQEVAVGVFSLCYIHFKTDNIDKSIGFLPFIYSSGTVSAVAVKQICLKEGRTPSIWIPHSSEINEGITTINEDGIQVAHNNIKTKTRMTADGFYFLDENDDMFASLSSKDTWASLRVQEVFANNIENVYTGSANLYVNHSKTSAGDGSSSSPFNSFGVLQEYLESMPIINKDLTIYIQNPNMEINEQLTLTNLKGTGSINIIFDKNCILRSSKWAIVLTGINKLLAIDGGRSSYDSSDGAIVLDKGNESCIHIIDCKDVYIHNININCRNNGIRATRSRLRTRNIDFCQTWCAIELNENSMGYDGDSCGNCNDFVRSVTGSVFTYGASGGGICPFGIKAETSGKIFLVGNDRTQRGSYRYPTADPVPPAPTTATYTKTFKATGFGTYQYTWSNWASGEWGNRAIQGNYQNIGNKAGHVFFDLSAIRSFLGSGTVGSCTITITRRNGGGVSGATNIYVNASSVSSASGTPSYSHNSKLGTLSWGQTATFNLSSNIVNALKSSAGSIAFYSSSDTTAYAEIVACSITIKVTK